MYLELAENNNQNYYSMMAQAPAESSGDLYVYMPPQLTGGDGMYVREDSFDLLPDFQFDQLQNLLEPFQQRDLGLFGLGKKGRARRQARRKERQARKLQRIEVRGESGGGALGRIGNVISNIFGGGPEEMAPVYGPEPVYGPPPRPFPTGAAAGAGAAAVGATAAAVAAAKAAKEEEELKGKINILGMKVAPATAAIGGVGIVFLIFVAMGRIGGGRRRKR